MNRRRGVISDVGSKTVDMQFYESIDRVIAGLLEGGLGKGSPLEERLVLFRLWSRDGAVVKSSA